MASDDRGAVLFCPFCREAFEGERECPDHELPLVPFEELPGSRAADPPRQDEPVSPYDPRFGRGLLFAAAAVVLAGFLLPFATTSMDGESLTMTGFEMAARRPLLWAVPFVAGAFIAVLAFRRTPRQMRGARLALPLLAGLGLAALAFGVVIVRGFAADRRRRYGFDIEVTLEPGIWVMAAGLLLAVVAGLRLGAARHTEVLPHGARVDDRDDRDRIVMHDDD